MTASIVQGTSDSSNRERFRIPAGIEPGQYAVLDPLQFRFCTSPLVADAAAREYSL